MSEEMTEHLNVNTKAERIRFVLLVIGFIALAMVSQRQETSTKKANKTTTQQVQQANAAVVCAQK